MSPISNADSKMLAAGSDRGVSAASNENTVTAFVESCVETVAGSAQAAERRARGRPRFGKLLRLLHDKRNILVTTHRYPDPDALASGWALCLLLTAKLPDATITMSVKDQISGGMNEMFIRHSNLKLEPWDDSALVHFDAIILTDVLPDVAYSPLPEGFAPLAVIDHHRTRRRPKCPFCDVRTDVGATSSIIFSYYMEVEQPFTPDLAASLLYAIESDLAGAAGQPGELDNIALSSLTLLANTRKLYQMRYVDLPQSYYVCYHSGLSNAMYYDSAIISHLDTIDSPEKPAVVADILLRFEPVQWALVTAVYENRLVISLRTSSGKLSAADMIRRLIRGDGEGGGHRTKAGGFIPLETNTPAEIDRKRAILRRRYLRALKIKSSQGKRLVPKAE
ncbi:MAG TPA: DHH family phosphoesterase [Tepidisphaeraceae bacterium]|jgi:nanoRNase/pAp phosphatase (c-di-AMP/oligoRNAs hydrolase)|nr:DHH family phosphoesterase [Tepidisphaeraceae bacterium]